MLRALRSSSSRSTVAWYLRPASAEVSSIHDRSGSAGGRAAGQGSGWARAPDTRRRSEERRPAATRRLTLLQVERQKAGEHASQERDWVVEQSSRESAVDQVAAGTAASAAATPAAAAGANPARCPAAVHWCCDRSPAHSQRLTQLW